MASSQDQTDRTPQRLHRLGDSGVPFARITMPAVAVLAVAGAVAGAAIAFARVGAAADAAGCLATRNVARLDDHDRRMGLLEAEQARDDERWERIRADLHAIRSAQLRGADRLEEALDKILHTSTDGSP